MTTRDDLVSPRLYIEPYAGAGAVFLRLLGGPRCQPVVSWMGGKRRLASHILTAMGLRPGQGCDQLVLADAGEWGWVWPLLLDPIAGARVAEVIRSWAHEDPRALWFRLAADPPAEDLHARAAQWLWLQARAASGVPVFWVAGDLKQGDKARTRSDFMQGSGGGRPPQPAGQRNTRAPGQKGTNRAGCGGKVDIAGFAEEVGRVHLVASDGRGVYRKAGQKRWAGPGGKEPMSVRTMAGRVRRLSRSQWSPPLIHHGNALDLLDLLPDDLRGSHAYLDPPYVSCTGYGWDSPRCDVLTLARELDRRGCVVAVSEAVSLAHELGWSDIDLTPLGRGKAEWLTVNREIGVSVAVQIDLFSEAS